ncbi:MAG: DNA polymerase III subunit delta [Actinobacteria bacterium]|nr:DNA polymerase III subunit delta [Actinomycetota bacterium]
MTTPAVPVHLVKGEDPSLVQDALSRIIHELAGDDAFAIEDVSDAPEPVAAAVDACRTLPFLADQRIVVLRDVGRFRTEELVSLSEYLDDPSPTAVLVLAAGGGQTSQKLTAAVRKVGHVTDVTVPAGKGRATWIADQLKGARVKLERAAADQLSTHLGEDTGRLPGLLAMLAAAYGDGAKLGVEEIEPFLGDAGGVAPWDLTDAIDSGATELAINQLHRMVAGGERHPLVVMATLHRHYASMLRLDGSGVTNENEAAALLGAKPYPAKKALNQSRRLGRAALGRAIELLAAADLDLRGASAWPEELVLEVLVARLSRLAPRAGARTHS